jgi:hypothetical protein
LVIVPFAVREVSWIPPWGKWTLTLAAAALTFVLNAWEFKPDKRIDKIRKANLDEKLDGIFADAIARVAEKQRLPFRVNIMVFRVRFGCWPVLAMVYNYGMKPSDADYGLSWRYGTGLCWHVRRTGRAAYWDRNVTTDGSVRTTKSQLEKTSHVQAVISLPVRSAHGKDGEPLAKVRAVLNVDALSAEAARQLQDYWQEIAAGNNHPLLDLADYAGLYY